MVLTASRFTHSWQKFLNSKTSFSSNNNQLWIVETLAIFYEKTYVIR